MNYFCSQADPWDYTTDNSRILGLCTGALAAAAVGCSRSTLELIPIAVDAVIVAFRTGMYVTDVAQRVESSDASNQSWSVIVPGLASIEAVHKFNEQTVRTPHRISHISQFLLSVADWVPESDTSPD